MDRTAAAEVWNQPIVSYDVTEQKKVTSAEAQRCVNGEGATYSYNDKAKELYEVTTRVSFLVEGDASERPLGMEGYVSSDTYHYILELGATGKVIGGRYCSDSERPDFFWAPVRASTGGGRNPHVALDKVKQLIDLSMADAGPSSEADSYENRMGVAIPDNAPGGASLDIVVPDSFSFVRVTISAEIAHPYVGDLVVELHKNGTRVATVHEHSGGSADNLSVAATLSAEQVGGNAAKATWTLKVIDTEPQDAGRLDSFKLTFAR
jgi:hypothetical protein